MFLYAITHECVYGYVHHALHELSERSFLRAGQQQKSISSRGSAEQQAVLALVKITATRIRPNPLPLRI